ILNVYKYETQKKSLTTAADDVPTNASRKLDIQNWLRSKNISFHESLLKVELLQIVNEHKAEYNKYRIDEMAKEKNKLVLRLPLYHCELNPTELVWAEIKNAVAEKKTIRSSLLM
ncbi:unnamed protein product, partial [Callosobruchus maculatus]